MIMQPIIKKNAEIHGVIKAFYVFHHKEIIISKSCKIPIDSFLNASELLIFFFLFFFFA